MTLLTLLTLTGLVTTTLIIKQNKQLARIKKDQNKKK